MTNRILKVILGIYNVGKRLLTTHDKTQFKIFNHMQTQNYINLLLIITFQHIL